MEVWYDIRTKEVKAIYTGRYTGKVWQDAGYVSFSNDDRQIDRDLIPGAIVDFSGGAPIVVTPAPIPPPDSKAIRLEELRAELSTGTITLDGIKEMMRLERDL